MADDRYQRVTFRGHTVNRWTMAALLACEADLGYELTIIQGSYHKGVGASAGTHDGGGAVDLAPYQWVRKVRALRNNGFAAWHRPAIRGLWSEHVHAILIGDDDATQIAKNQVTAYRAGYDGLGHLGRGGRDNGPRVPIRQFPYPPKEENSMANFTEAQLRKIVREESERAVAKYVGDVVAVSKTDPQYNPKNPHIWVATAVRRIMERQTKK